MCLSCVLVLNVFAMAFDCCSVRISTHATTKLSVIESATLGFAGVAVVVLLLLLRYTYSPYLHILVKARE